jgi:hypothetical protein
MKLILCIHCEIFQLFILCLGCFIEYIVPVVCVLHTGSFKRKKSSFAQDLTDVSKKGAKRMRYEYVFLHFNYGIISFLCSRIS